MVTVWFKRKGLTRVATKRVKNYKVYIDNPERLPKFNKDEINKGVKNLEEQGILEVIDFEEAQKRLKKLAGDEETEEEVEVEDETEEDADEETEEEVEVDEEDLQDKTYNELVEVAKENNISGYSTENKEGLIELIQDELS